MCIMLSLKYMLYKSISHVHVWLSSGLGLEWGEVEKSWFCQDNQ